MKEIWRDVPNFKGLYKISNFGRVASLDRTIIFKNGAHYHKHGKIMKLIESKRNNSAITVGLYKNSKIHNKYVSRLVAKAFLPNPKNLPVVQHINGDSTDNKVTNLKWSKNGIFTKHSINKIRANDVQRVRIIKHTHHHDFNSINDAATWIKKQTKTKSKIKNIANHISKCCRHGQSHKLTHGFKARYLGKILTSKKIKQPKNEIWKTIPNYINYQVSNYGNVRSKPRIAIDKNGVVRHLKGKILNLSRDCNGYKRVTLFKNSKFKFFRVHRLVAQVFIPNPHHYPLINHKDENTGNNKVSNLEWCTVTYNDNYGNKSVKTKIANIRPITLIKDDKTYRFPSVQSAARWLKNKGYTKAKIRSISNELGTCYSPRKIHCNQIYGFTIRRV